MQTFLQQASIFGLWGIDKEVRIPLDRQFNFLIGRNGTGKTTVINLLAAALTADFEQLDKTQFSKITISLNEVSGRKKPSIEITKQAKAGLPYDNIEYKIRSSASSEPTVFDLDLITEERAYRGMPQRFMRDRTYRQKYVYIQSQLESMVSINWLSVHRATRNDRTPEELRYATAIDQKLADLNNSLVRYFSKLSSTYEEKAANFQKRSFLSLVSIQNDEDLEGFVKSFDLEGEKTSLVSIFQLLGVEQSQYKKNVDRVVQDFDIARQKYLERNPLLLSELFAIATSFRTHSIVQLYERLQEERKLIYSPASKFIEVVNSLLAPRKKISISSQNELIVEGSKDNRRIELDDLSSGEKQLLIILGQALLQESASVVFIADEPELSLHVEWQERLTPSIAELNPNAQIVFATHSPDIVGAYTNRIIDMETIA